MSNWPSFAKVELTETEIIVHIPYAHMSIVNPGKQKLTRREAEVYEAMGRNKERANKEIACALGITERTVKFHVSEILKKLGVTSRHEL